MFLRVQKKLKSNSSLKYIILYLNPYKNKLAFKGMKVVYTVEPIEGIVEYSHPPFQTRVAKEKLKAIVEEVLIPKGLVSSYTLADD